MLSAAVVDPITETLSMFCNTRLHPMPGHSIFSLLYLDPLVLKWHLFKTEPTDLNLPLEDRLYFVW